MIINGRIPGDPKEVARAMAEKGGEIPTAYSVVTVAGEEKVADDAQEQNKAEEVNTAKPEEKKATVKKGSRKSSKKAEKEAGLFTDVNAE